jgi:hypothetical protein
MGAIEICRQRPDLMMVYLFGLPIYRKLPTSETTLSFGEKLSCDRDFCYGFGM